MKNVGLTPPKGAGLRAVYMTSEDYVSAFEEKVKADELKEREKQQKRELRARKKVEKASQKQQKLVGGSSSTQKNNISKISDK